MQHALNLVFGLIVSLFNVVVVAIAAVEGAVRRLLTDVGIGGPMQTIILVLVVVLLAVAAFRLLGRVFGVLIVLFLLLLLVHAVTTGGAGTGIAT